MLNNVEIETYKRHINDSHKEIDKVQWSNQYELDIYMLKPIKKHAIPNAIIKNVEFNRHSLSAEPIEVGNTFLYRFGEPLPETISITFYNQIKLSLQHQLSGDLFSKVYNIEDMIINNLDTVGGVFGYLDLTAPVKNFVTDFFQPIHTMENTVSSLLSDSSITSLFSMFDANIIDLTTADYFTKVGYMDILPKDGTMLLADDWTFNIELKALNANWYKKSEVKGTYIIDGDIAQTFGSDQDQMQEITIQFKRTR